MTAENYSSRDGGFLWIISQALGSRIFFFSIISKKCASTTYMNPFDMLRCEINAFMNYTPFS